MTDATQRSLPGSVARNPIPWLTVALTVVASLEGYYGHPYRDSVGVKTICYGATAADKVDFSRIYTKAECLDLLGKDLPKYDKQVQKCLTQKAFEAMPPSRHAAIVSFTYNVGGGALCKSSVARNLNAGRIRAACDSLLLYNRAGGRVLRGLTYRRQFEHRMCLKDD